MLQRHFVETFARQYSKSISGLTRRAQQLLAWHHWPGNVRELEDVIGNACLMAEGGVIDVADLPSYLRTSRAGSDDEEAMSIDELQRRHVATVLRRVGENKAKAAEVLGISRGALYRIFNELGQSEEYHSSDTEKTAGLP